MKRRFIILTATLLCLLLLAGCGQAETTGNADTPTTEASADTTATQEEGAAQSPEPTAEPTPAPTEEPTPEPTAEPTPEPTEEPTPEPTAEPTPAPQITYTYTDMNVTMYAIQTVNVRNLPSTDGEKVGSLSTNQEVIVTGQCNETNWYRFDYNGQTTFVSNKYLSTEKVAVAPPAQSTENDGGTVTPAPNTSSLPNFPYPLHTWTQQTSEEGCPILVIYSTYSTIGEIRWGTPSPTPDIFRTEGELGLLWTTVSAYADTHGYGCHFLYPVTKVGDYAEGTIYQCIAGAHYSTTPGGCPNFETGICKPGTID